MTRYLKIILLPECEEDLDPIINGLRTTLDREPILDEEGDAYMELLSDEELMSEAFCLGMCYRELEDEGFEVPFDIEVVVLAEPPTEHHGRPN